MDIEQILDMAAWLPLPLALAFVVWLVCADTALRSHRDSRRYAIACAVGVPLRPFMFPLIIAMAVAGHTAGAGDIVAASVSSVGTAVQLLCWWPLRHLPHDDGRWKRRRRRIRDAVRAIGTRLTVVPALGRP